MTGQRDPNNDGRTQKLQNADNKTVVARVVHPCHSGNLCKWIWAICE